MKSLLFTADDFGLHPSINEGIVKLYQEGVVDQASFMVGTKYFDESVKLLNRNHGLSVGVHLNLTDGAPVLESGKVDTLVNTKGEFVGGRHYKVLLNLILGKYDLSQIEEEWAAQIEKAQNAGFTVKFINSHGHLHLLPILHDTVLKLASKYNIGTVRVSLNSKGPKGLILKLFSHMLIAKIKSRKLSVDYPAQVLGIDHQGHLNKESISKELRNAMIGKNQEFIVHPAVSSNVFHKQWGYDTKEEFTALLNLG